MITENLESVIRRVQKLLAIAEHERIDPHPEIPFSNVEPDGLPTAKEAVFCSLSSSF